MRDLETEFLGSTAKVAAFIPITNELIEDAAWTNWRDLYPARRVVPDEGLDEHEAYEEACREVPFIFNHSDDPAKSYHYHVVWEET